VRGDPPDGQSTDDPNGRPATCRTGSDGRSVPLEKGCRCGHRHTVCSLDL